jgi:hypothetical protein
MDTKLWALILGYGIPTDLEKGIKHGRLHRCLHSMVGFVGLVAYG